MKTCVLRVSLPRAANFATYYSMPDWLNIFSQQGKISLQNQLVKTPIDHMIKEYRHAAEKHQGEVIDCLDMINVFSAGTFIGAEGADEIVLSDPELGVYKKLVIADNKLTRAVLFGDTADGLWYLDLIRSGTKIDAMRDVLAFGRAMAERAKPAPARLAA